MSADERANKMVVVRLRSLECIRTRSGEQTEEPYLNLYVDDFPHATWGPVSMRDGDTVQIHWGELQGSRIIIQLVESDTRHGPDGVVHRRDDELAVVEFTDDTEEGSYDLILPHHEGMTGGMRQRRYKLYLDVLRGLDSRLPTGRYSLELVSVRCNNAQESEDEVFIKVNGEKVWHARMRSGHTLSVDPDSSRTIGAWATITLWEEDTSNRNDFFGECRLHVGEDFDFDEDHIHTFSRDRGIVGDARYTLTYRVSRR